MRANASGSFTLIINVSDTYKIYHSVGERQKTLIMFVI